MYMRHFKFYLIAMNELTQLHNITHPKHTHGDFILP